MSEARCTGCRYNIRKDHLITDHPEEVFYVQDERSMVGNCIMWWCPRGAGYTTQIDEAGFYTREDIKQMRDTDVGWPVAFVEEHVVRHVRRDHLRNARTVETVRKNSVPRREKIIALTSDLVADFLYYDRKEDEDLPRGSIEEAVKADEISADEIIEYFAEALREGLG